MRRLVLGPVVVAMVTMATLLALPRTAAAQMPPWPPPAPAPPFPSTQPTPGQLPPLAPGPGATAAPAPAPAGAPTASPALGSATLKVGSSGAAVTALQQRLKALAYDPGGVDGKFGGATVMAVYAFQKVQGLQATGVVDSAVLGALNSPKGPPVHAASAGGNRVEVDLGRQLLMAYRNGGLALISHISSGSGKAYCENGHCGNAITPRGSFKILWSRAGWETAPLGQLYNPQYFTTAGHAIHGSTSVPLYPASHGCVRIPMHTAGWFPTLTPKGTPVIVV